MENQNENAKNIALISYITFIGWIIAFVMHGNEKQKSELAAFHLRQTLGIYLTGLALFILSMMLIFIPFIGWLIIMAINLVYLGLFVLWILGIVSAANAEAKPIPLVGQFYQDLLAGIK